MMLKSLIKALVALNLIFWTAPLIYEIYINRFVNVEGVVINTQLLPGELVTGDGIGVIQGVNVRVQYQFRKLDYLSNINTNTINNVIANKDELRKYYVAGKKLMIWVNPEDPHIFLFHNKNRYLELPEIFLSILILLILILIFKSVFNKNE